MLPIPEGLHIRSQAYGVSGDGSTVVGFGQSASGTQAYQWDATNGVQGLGDLAGGGFSSSADGVSAGAKIIVGGGKSASGLEAFRWDATNRMQGLGDLARGIFPSEALAVSADGSTIVGSGVSTSGVKTFIWDSDNRMREINTVLTALGVDVTGWTLTQSRSLPRSSRQVVRLRPSTTR